MISCNESHIDTNGDLKLVFDTHDWFGDVIESETLSVHEAINSLLMRLDVLEQTNRDLENKIKDLENKASCLEDDIDDLEYKIEKE